MQNNLLRNIVKVDEDVKQVTLDESDKRVINRLLRNALKRNFIMYFDARYVEEIYDDYEFKDEEEEFYYNNSKSYLVFRDITDFEVRIPYGVIYRVKENISYETIIEITKIAIDFSKKHPGLSKHKLR